MATRWKLIFRDFKKDEITVELDDGYLTISAAKGLDQGRRRKNPDVTSAESVMQVPAAGLLCVGEGVTEEDIKAEFKHGILTLVVPKKEAKPAVEHRRNTLRLKDKDDQRERKRMIRKSDKNPKHPLKKEKSSSKGEYGNHEAVGGWREAHKSKKKHVY